MRIKKVKIAILGSTGSIGKTTLDILEKYKNKFQVNMLVCNKNKKIILEQIKKFLPKYVIISDINVFNYIKKINFRSKIKIFNSLKDFNENCHIKFDKVILGISSIYGLEYAFSFIKFSKEILIANKETIVCGGKFFLKKAKKYNCTIKSIDSEHYCLTELLENQNKNLIKNIYITASGGPFLNKSKKSYAKINSKEALKHPNWKMGKKISIDSATMANKSLEIMEASILFDLDPNKIKIKIHQQSKIHAAIILNNGLVKFIAHNTSMKIPIINSLIKNNEINFNKNFFLNKKKFNFSFDEIKLKKFKLVGAAYKAINYGPRACIVFNVINDFLVNLYLNKKIFFYEIEDKLIKIIYNKKLTKFYKKKITNIKDIYETIFFAKKLVKGNF